MCPFLPFNKTWSRKEFDRGKLWWDGVPTLLSPHIIVAFFVALFPLFMPFFLILGNFVLHDFGNTRFLKVAGIFES
jgi:hypothetical protein